MTPADWLREISRRKVPDRLYDEAAKIIESQAAMIVKLAERIDLMREILAKRAERPACVMRRDYAADKARLDWLASVSSGYKRAAIDAAMKGEQ